VGACASQRNTPAHVGSGSIATDEVEVTRSRMSASPLKADNLHTISANPLSARKGHMQRSKTKSLDHLVGGHEQAGRYGQAERLRRLEVEGRCEFGRRLYRKVGGLVAA